MLLGPGKHSSSFPLRFLPLISPFLFSTTAWSIDDRAASQQIDQLVEKAYQKHRVQPNAPASDEIFLRRAYLDIIGRVPTYAEAKAFQESKSPGKRSVLIDHLLDSPGYVSHSFNYWADLLRVKSRMEGQAGEAYADWVKASLRENKPYDKLVFELLTAEGYVWENGAVGYYLRDSGMPLDNMSNTTQIFLGTQLVCAQCHNHPFDKWTQKQYYQLAAYTYGVETNVNPNQEVGLDKIMEKKASKKRKRDTDEPSEDKDRFVREALNDLLQPLSYAVRDSDRHLSLPDDYKYRDGKPGEMVKPDTIFGGNATSRREARRAYAKWMTSPENPRFTKVVANRLWKRALGVGLVEPLDDFRDDTVASHPELLDFLSKQMVAYGYDMKRFLRMIYNTRTYQREATSSDYTPETYRFPGPVLRRMSAEQLWDSILTATIPGVDERKRLSDYAAEQGVIRRQAEALLKKSPQQILVVAKKIAEVEKEHSGKAKALREARASAREQKNKEAEKRLGKELDLAEKARDERIKLIREEIHASNPASPPPMMTSMKPLEKLAEKNTRKVEDMRWSQFPKDWARASELSSPAPENHFLRLFGQSDRETIEAANGEASVSQALALLNGHTFDQLVGEHSELTKGLAAQPDEEKKQDFIFLSLLSRTPHPAERDLMKKQFAELGPDKAAKATIWALLNTRELAFIR